MIFLDCETTGLLNPRAAKLEDQPKITELSLVKTRDDDCSWVDEREYLFSVDEELEELIVKLTGITNKMLEGQPKFSEKYQEIAEFFLGERIVVAHNCPFDMGMIWVELSRIEKEFHFPWPIEWICTVEKTFHFEHRRMKLADLHELLTGKPHSDKAHRAKEDVYALIRCFIELKKKNIV